MSHVVYRGVAFPFKELPLRATANRVYIRGSSDEVCSYINLWFDYLRGGLTTCSIHSQSLSDTFITPCLHCCLKVVIVCTSEALWFSTDSCLYDFIHPICVILMAK